MAEDSRLTGPAIQGLLAHLLAGAAGGNEAKWRKLIGEVEILPIAFHPRGNWRVVPKGSIVEQDAIAKAVAVVRAEHPYARE